VRFAGKTVPGIVVSAADGSSRTGATIRRRRQPLSPEEAAVAAQAPFDASDDPDLADDPGN
jgi:hypothetical protein